MKYFVMSIRDSAAAAYAQPFYAPAEQVAIRSVKDMVNRDDNQVHKHPEDFELYCLGLFDDSKGEVTPEAPRLIARCKDLVRFSEDK